MPAFGAQLAKACRSGSVIYLQGTLGMGKTTLSRCVVEATGWQGRVKSPTYTLVEQYSGNLVEALHFDLYRLADPEELEFLGVRDFDQHQAIWLIEWPERGAGLLPPADIEVYFEDAQNSRKLRLVACSDKGAQQLQQMEAMA
ncbi:tRNA (adenosine(37)-N6)-threonylcarbamoyltransferase complex ATPase subunit type 1 TsaE [Reinekea thalattae]|uniref:tRNA threonylcarbamoyladenosine biosynthesis protein TsaE n=2 Tax=Reinekea thalattae TaxID=2593301 RepID=A0A5C8ZDH7_9GAMM|nr:tRNA (adenosine(37)-N6)-threonylcarbamoyltransferase complex ATPase subunit type 1 TsaE [Reinekea thalattae]